VSFGESRSSPASSGNARATVNYLVTETFNPEREKGLSVLDSDIGLVFPDDIGEILLSPKDTSAPTLGEAESLGLLPTWDECQAFYQQLRTEN